MKARCISYSGDHATVVLDPGPIDWLRGRRTLSVDLERLRFHDGTTRSWEAVATRRNVDQLPFGALIRDALDFREVGSEPRRVKALIGGVVAP